MLRITITLVVALCACAHVSAGSTADLEALVKKKAAFELSCTEAAITLTEMSNGQQMNNGFSATNQKSYGAEGCGKRAGYYAYCTNMMGSLNCDAMQSGQPIAAPR